MSLSQVEEDSVKSIQDSNNQLLMNLNNHEKENSGHQILVKTVQASAFRTLVEALKDILQDVNIEFDESGIKIVAMDVSHTVLVHLKLDSNSFEHYYCKKKILLV